MTEDDGTFWAPRRCLREPIPEIFEAAMLLDAAVAYHASGAHGLAAQLIKKTDCDRIRSFTESLWGSPKKNPDQPRHLRWRKIDGLPEPDSNQLDPKRLATQSDEKAIVSRWGRHCLFCGVPLIHKSVPKALQAHYPELKIWGPKNRNADQHAAFQLMWMQFDHVVPHRRGGRTDDENVVVTCAPCNYGKGDWVLEELGLNDPRLLPVVRTSWDGLERLFVG